MEIKVEISMGQKSDLMAFLLALDLSNSAIAKSKSTWTATLGLVVHAAADGIALGNRRLHG